MNNTGFDKRLGTSKREQGIITPKQPKRLKCGCWIRNNIDGTYKVLSQCVAHKTILAGKVKKIKERGW